LEELKKDILIRELDQADIALLKSKKGKLTWTEYAIFLAHKSPAPCQACSGTGELVDMKGEKYSCPFCEGIGIQGAKRE
jgi:DnaJ-class molecular chaperone